MTVPPKLPSCAYYDLDQFTAVAQCAVRQAQLEYARLGRSISVARDGVPVWLTPTEVFAQYGLDEHGNPPATSPRPTA